MYVFCFKFKSLLLTFLTAGPVITSIGAETATSAAPALAALPDGSLG